MNLLLLLSTIAAAQDPGTPAPSTPAEPAPAAPAMPDPGPPPAAEGVVDKVEITGLKRVEEAVLLDAVGLRVGETLSGWKVQRDIRAIWNTGYVDDVRAELVPSGNATIVRFVVHEKPAVREWRLIGNKKIKEDDLKEAVDIEPMTVPSEARIAQNARALRDKYLEKGFYLATVEPQLTPVGDNLVELSFKITEGRKVIVQRVDISGNDGVPDAKIKRYMQTKAGGIVPWLTSTGTFIQDNLDNDVEVVRSVMLEEGYVDAQVDPPKVYLSPDKRYIYVSIHVNEGPRYKLGTIDVRGDFSPQEGLTKGAVQALVDGKDLRDVQEAFTRDKDAGVAVDENWSPRVVRRVFDFSGQNTPMKAGEWFKLTTMQGLTERIRDLYGDQGYAFATVEPVPRPNADDKTVDVSFIIQKGDKMRIGRINISGNDPTYDKVIRREVPIDEGDIYKGSALRDARARLERLGFFDKVDFATPRGAEAGTLDVNFDVTEKPTGSFTVGAGFSSVDSFLLTANIQKTNFLGLGWITSLGVNISKTTQQGNISFYDPHFLDSRWTFNIQGFYTQRDYLEQEYQRGGSLQIGRYIDQRDDIRLAVDYTLEDIGLTSIDDYKARLYGGELYRNGVTSSAGLNFDIDKRNNRISATRGFKASADLSLAGGFRTDDQHVAEVLGGNFNFVEAKGNFRFFQPLDKKELLVFRYNLSIGKIMSTDGSVVPYIHRYRAGGITSIRGYEPYALGPSVRATGYRDYTQTRTSFVGYDDPSAADDRLVIGGTETLVNNFEIESPVLKSAGISLVTFFDAGNTFGDAEGNGHIDLAELRTSVGFGVRWFSPIGPLRFEWGFPLDPHDDERKAVFDFTIGNAF